MFYKVKKLSQYKMTFSGLFLNAEPFNGQFSY